MTLSTTLSAKPIAYELSISEDGRNNIFLATANVIQLPEFGGQVTRIAPEWTVERVAAAAYMEASARYLKDSISEMIQAQFRDMINQRLVEFNSTLETPIYILVYTDLTKNGDNVLANNDVVVGISYGRVVGEELTKFDLYRIPSSFNGG